MKRAILRTWYKAEGLTGVRKLLCRRRLEWETGHAMGIGRREPYKHHSPAQGLNRLGYRKHLIAIYRAWFTF